MVSWEHSTLTESVRNHGFAPSILGTLVPPLCGVLHGSLRQPLVLTEGRVWHLYVVPTLKKKVLLGVLIEYWHPLPTFPPAATCWPKGEGDPKSIGDKGCFRNNPPSYPLTECTHSVPECVSVCVIMLYV